MLRSYILLLFLRLISAAASLVVAIPSSPEPYPPGFGPNSCSQTPRTNPWKAVARPIDLLPSNFTAASATLDSDDTTSQNPLCHEIASCKFYLFGPADHGRRSPYIALDHRKVYWLSWTASAAMRLSVRVKYRDGSRAVELIWNSLGPGFDSKRFQGDFSLGFEMYNVNHQVLKGEIGLFETEAVQGSSGLVADS
ncbi:hypothetical protein ACLMJK_007037 [Lecanora helva]